MTKSHNEGPSTTKYRVPCQHRFFPLFTLCFQQSQLQCRHTQSDFDAHAQAQAGSPWAARVFIFRGWPASMRAQAFLVRCDWTRPKVLAFLANQMHQSHASHGTHSVCVEIIIYKQSTERESGQTGRPGARNEDSRACSRWTRANRHKQSSKQSSRPTDQQVDREQERERARASAKGSVTIVHVYQYVFMCLYTTTKRKGGEKVRGKGGWVGRMGNSSKRPKTENKRFTHSMIEWIITCQFHFTLFRVILLFQFQFLIYLSSLFFVF